MRRTQESRGPTRGHSQGLTTAVGGGQVYNIPGYREVRNAEAIKPLVARVAVSPFEPRSDIKIQTEEKGAEEGGQQADSSEWVEQVRLLRRCCQRGCG